MKMNKNLKNALLWILDLAVNIAVIFGLVLVVQTWIIAPFDVSGASMCDTLNLINGECQSGYGEKIIISETSYLFGSPERGDIVVFKPKIEEDKYFIKRIIGLPGETVEIKNGKVFITTVDKKTFELDEEYLNKDNAGKTKTFFSDFSVFEIPQNDYFVLGDNRNFSTDSRSCFQGFISSECRKNPEKAFIPISNIRGKAWVVWWPISNIETIDSPLYKNSASLDEK
jgi:signal peptidase I